MNLNDTLNNFFDSRLSNVNTCLPARIEEFDPVTKKASVQVVVKRLMKDGSFESYPIINNVPVLLPYFNQIGLFVPVQVGSFCLLVFSQRSLDKWKTYGGEIEDTDSRMFDLTDAVAIPGLMPFNEESGIEGNEDIYLRNGQIMIKLQDDAKIAIGTTTNELLDIISQLLGLLSGLIVPPSPGPNPLPLTVAAQITALQVKIDAIKGVLP